MINNRQAGRRRGRGGQQQRSQGGNPGRGQDNGNRIDNRARGNAAQLLEKYKALARDAQMQGDRVNTEYYLQFADHYFRVLAETRARFEETNPSSQGQGRRLGGANTFDEDEQDYEDEGEPIRGEQSQPPRQQPNGNQNGNGHAQNGANGGQRNGNGQSDDDRPRRDDRPERQPRQERFADDRRPQRDGNRQDGRQDGRREAREDTPRAGQQPDLVEQAAEHAPADQPEVAVAAVTPAPETPAAEPPAAEPRRRGRPRRTAPVEAEPAPIFDAGLLPPSLTASAAPAEAAPVQDAAPVADADAEPAEKPRRRRGRPPATEPVQA